MHQENAWKARTSARANCYSGGDTNTGTGTGTDPDLGKENKEENMKVVVRVRPLQKHEIGAGDTIAVKV